MFYSRTSEALFLFIRLLLAGYVVLGTYLTKPATREIIKKWRIIKRFKRDINCIPESQFGIDILNCVCYNMHIIDDGLRRTNEWLITM